MSRKPKVYKYPYAQWKDSYGEYKDKDGNPIFWKDGAGVAGTRFDAGMKLESEFNGGIGDKLTSTAKKIPGAIKDTAKLAGSVGKLGIDASVLSKETIDVLGGMKDMARGKLISGGKKVINAAKSKSNKIKNDVKEVVNKTRDLISGLNHKEWYLNIPGTNELININLAMKKGIPLTSLSEYDSSGMDGMSVPSIASCWVDLVVPRTTGQEWGSGIRTLYSRIRGANMGSINYDVYDLERYVLNLRSLHAGYCIVQRAYSILNNVSKYDVGTPDIYLRALGLDPESCYANAANLRAFGNKLGVTLHEIAPLKIDLFERTRWMFGNIFKDSNDAKSQKYVFITYNLPYFGDSNVLNYQVGDSAGLNAGTLMDNVQKMLDNFKMNNRFAIIAGDILRAYGADSLYDFPIWNERAKVSEIYDEAALTQIQNASLAVYGVTNASFEVAPDKFITTNIRVDLPANTTYRNTIITNAVNSTLTQPIVNSYKDSIDAGDVLSMTRFTAIAHLGDPNNTSTETYFDVFGTEIMDSISIWYINGNNAIASTTVTRFEPYLTMEGSNIEFYEAAEMAVSFDYFPMYYEMLLTQSGTDKVIDGMTFPIFDFNNFGIAYKENVDAYHGYAVLSMLSADRLVKVSTTTLIK